MATVLQRQKGLIAAAAAWQTNVNWHEMVAARSHDSCQVCHSRRTSLCFCICLCVPFSSIAPRGRCGICR